MGKMPMLLEATAKMPMLRGVTAKMAVLRAAVIFILYGLSLIHI